MEKVIISIETVNAAFDENEGNELARILKEIAEKLENGSQPELIRDINGNKVGKIEYL